MCAGVCRFARASASVFTWVWMCSPWQLHVWCSYPEAVQVLPYFVLQLSDSDSDSDTYISTGLQKSNIILRGHLKSLHIADKRKNFHMALYPLPPSSNESVIDNGRNV